MENISEEKKTELIAQFLSTTNLDAETASGYLESSNWDLKIALDLYFKHQDEVEVEAEAENVSNQGTSNSIPSNSDTTKSFPVSKPQNKFKTLSDFKNEEETEGQDLFAGGQKSGTAIRYPGMPDNVNSLLDGLFSKVNNNPPEDEETLDTQERSSFFTGTGTRLGESTQVSNQQSSSIPGSFPDQVNSSSDGELVVKNLTLWRNGLTLEDGPLLTYTSSEGQEFLQAINDGYAPLHMLGIQRGQRVDLHVQRRMEEDYIPPPVTVKPFQGAGNRLGNVVPSISNDLNQPPESTIKAPVQTHQVDPSLPQTSVQIRLSDGSRLVVKFNHHHTIADLYNYVELSTNTNRPFILQTTFPIKTLDDRSLSLKDANVLNAAVIQKFV